MAFFVLKQTRVDELNRTFDSNVRMGGYRTKKAAFGAAKRLGMCLVKDDFRNVVAQTISAHAPSFIY